MLRLATVVICLFAVACGNGDGEGGSESPPAADLTVTVWPDGRGGPERGRRVTCPELGAGQPVCRELSRRKLAPVPRLTPCTAIYGGPDVARVTGTLRGERVDAMFSLEDGCEIARWERNRTLLGPPR